MWSRAGSREPALSSDRGFEMNRRTFLFQVSGVVAAGVVGRRVGAQAIARLEKPTVITVYKSKSCGCCAEWVDYLATNGFQPAVHDEDDMDAIKAQLGVPEKI